MEGNRKEVASMVRGRGRKEGERVKLEGGKGEMWRNGSAREEKMRGQEVRNLY